jgi:TRAP-type C4-dicarboxylate transport system substrate-binding protein
MRKVVIPLFALLLVTSCGNDERANTQKHPTRVILTMASDAPPDEPDAELAAFAAAVEELSAGSVTIEIKDSWHLGEADYQTATLGDIRAGEMDLGSIAVRAFDNAGIDVLEPLIAPMLIDSHNVQQKVIDAGIPDDLLTELDRSGLVGIGVAPGELRLLGSRGVSVADPSAAQSLRLGFQESKVAEAFLSDAGATAVRLPTSAQISHVDGLEQQLNSIIGNSYYQDGLDHALGNLPLWPRFVAMVMNKDAFDALTADQQQSLEDAWASTMRGTVAEARETDEGAAELVCTNGVALDQATPVQAAAWRRIADEVTRKIATHGDNAEVIERLRKIKGNAPAQAFTCDSRTGDATTAAINGTYQFKVEKADLIAEGVSDADANENAGSFEIILADGTLSMDQTYTDGPKAGEHWTGSRAYSYDGTVIHMKFDAGDDTVIDADVAVEADGSLTFTNVSTPFADQSVLKIFEPFFRHWVKG